ncbi:NIF family HAD-type phosphatase [Gammaproteobacteria bacterium AS21]
MDFCTKTRKPINIDYAKALVIDRSGKKYKSMVCLELEGVLFKSFKFNNIVNVPKAWREGLIDVNYVQNDILEHKVLIERPGAAELLVELNKYCEIMIYSYLPEAFIEEALLRLSIAQGDPDFCTDDELEKGEAYYGRYIWSRDQCVKDGENYLKSLGILSDFSDDNINDIWLIDNKSELVDFPSHVVSVSDFLGDPEDKDLYRIMEEIFIN